MRTRRRSVVLGLSTISAALLLGTPGIALGATSSDIDLVAAQRTQTSVSAPDVGHDVTVEVGVYFHGTGTTAINEVTAHVVAPGGTKLNLDYLPSNCTGVTDHEATCPWSAQLWPGQGEGTPFYPWNFRLVLLSLQVTPGTFSVSCACDINPANNSTSFTLAVQGVATPPATPGGRGTTTAPRTAQTTRAAGPAVVPVTSLTPAALAPSSTTTGALTSSSSSEAAASNPVPSVTVADLTATRSSDGGSIPLVVTVTLACVFVAALVTAALLRRRARVRTSETADS